MTNSSKYSKIIEAKNGTLIPVFLDGKTVDSKYNPEREADNIINSLDKSYDFYIVLGIASGTLINNILQKNPNCKIIGIESTQFDIDFLLDIPLVKSLLNNENIIFSDIEHLEETLINNYLPAIYGDLKIIEQRGWISQQSELIPLINEKLSHSIGIISADYSVQSHFGKIWQNNIINNLKELNINNKNNSTILNIDINKTALIVAAGPSLDITIEQIKRNLNKYFIISTDTAYSILLKNEVIPDIVISIDGQLVSQNHFAKITKDKTIFLLDLCGNHTVGLQLIKKGCKICYFISGHPLSTLANNFNKNKFITLFSGAGTVTITALDLANKLGFTQIEIIGADFAYLNGKSYGKGSYFDSLFGMTNHKIESLEKKFDKLMYRTELSKISENNFTTSVLNAYKMSLELYLINNKWDFKNIKNIYYLTKNTSTKEITQLTSPDFDYDDFMAKLKSSDIEDIKIPLLPYIAWLRNNKKYKNIDFNLLLKLAQSHIVSYN